MHYSASTGVPGEATPAEHTPRSREFRFAAEQPHAFGESTPRERNGLRAREIQKKNETCLLNVQV